MTNDAKVVCVAVPVPVDGGLQYSCGRSPLPPVGGRVVVTVGRKQHIGVALEHVPEGSVTTAKLKPVLEILDETPVIDAPLLATLRWCAAYYHHPIGDVVVAALPALLRRGRPAQPDPEYAWTLTDAGRAIDRTVLARRASRQARLLEALTDEQPVPESDLRARGHARAELVKLAERGWLERHELTAERPVESPRAASTVPQLSPDQADALAALEAAGPGFGASLLHGVTGSGKTEVYMRLISAQLRDGRQSLLLVPEISLTPQLVGRLRKRFGRRLAVMHSALTDAERLRAWQACRSADAGLIIGTRSAVFAPLPRPGLIVVDEEHDASFKQGDGFRYSARDLAVFRARQLDIPIVLGSATPSFESFYNASRDRYRLLRLPRRIGSAGKPRVRLIDMNRHAEHDGLSTPMLGAITDHLAAGQQVMLFLNRRGFAPALFCPECCRAEECSRCDARMTVHATRGKLRCHHCGAEHALTWGCPRCGTERIAVGAGTQRVGEALRAHFPTVRVGRLDRDATSRRGSLEAVLADVAAGHINVLVGTQMLAKGHDFPNVTLVGVLNADQGLFGTDFRSNERLAQTIVQVSGRAGRADRPGEVLIQSHYPSHPLFGYLKEQDYSSFAAEALAEREAAQWPPFSHLVVIRAEATQRQPVFAFLARVVHAARSQSGETVVHGPAPAAMERRGGRHRAQVLLQSTRRAPLHGLVDALKPDVRSWPESRRVRWSIDVDPLEL
jgi:primosomal protein N' (replication factor Y)